MLPGVQVLFAFLLTVPFTSAYSRTTALQRDVYFAAFLTATASSILLIAPSAHHRLRWRRREKDRLLRSSNQLVIWGIFLLAVSMTCAIFVVTDVLFDDAWAALVAALGGAAFMAFWFVLPLVDRGRGDR